MKNKKGAEMTIGTIVIIILAVIVLVILVYGFSTGWSNLWQKITGFGGGKETVSSTVQSCQVACASEAKYDYCKTRKIVDETDTVIKVDSNVVDTCKKLEGYTAAGLSPCAAIPSC